VVIIALSAASYIEMRRTALAIAGERLSSLTTQFRDLFEQSGAQLRIQMATVRGKPALADFARTQSARDRDLALAALAYTGPQPEQVIATELRDLNSVVLLTTAAPGFGLDTLAAREALPRTLVTSTDSIIIGRYHWLRDTLIYAPRRVFPGATTPMSCDGDV